MLVHAPWNRHLFHPLPVALSRHHTCVMSSWPQRHTRHVHAGHVAWSRQQGVQEIQVVWPKHPKNRWKQATKMGQMAESTGWNTKKHVISGDSYNGDETPKQCDSSPSNTNKDTTSSILIFEMNHFLPGSTLQPDNDAVLRVMSFQSSSQVLPAFPALVFLAAWPGRSVWIYKSSQHRRTDTPAYFQTKSVEVWKYAARVQGKLPFPLQSCRTFIQVP